MNTKVKVALVGAMIVGVLCGIIIAARMDLLPVSRAESITAKRVSPAPAMVDLQNSFAAIYENMRPCVVNISTTTTVKLSDPFFDNFMGDDFFERFFGEKSPFQRKQQRDRTMKQQSLGSGFIIRSDGYILTNNHVVEKADEIFVTFSDNNGNSEKSAEDDQIKAELVGADPETDLAVLRIKTNRKLQAVPLGDSDAVRVGDWAVAIGNPFGFSSTLTVGVISAKARDIEHGPYTDYIQTDAAINPGNSGGPLFNIKGEVIGVNTAIFSRSGGYMGVGFTIPINLAKEVMNDLIESGHYSRGYIGITFQELDEKLARAHGLPKDATGVLVTNVLDDTPAQKAGIEPGDIIIQVGDVKITNGKLLQREVARLGAGRKAEVTVMRDGKKKTFTMTLAERPAEIASSGAPAPGMKSTEDLLGLELQDLTPQMARQIESKTEKGAVVTSVAPDSAAEAAEVMEGDIIIKADKKPVTSVSDFSKIVSKFKPGDDLLIVVERRGYNRFIVIAIPSDKK